MFKKLRKFFETKRDTQSKNNYDVSFDNVAIPEVHTHKTGKHKERKAKPDMINYDNVAIPEVHIRTKKKK